MNVINKIVAQVISEAKKKKKKDADAEKAYTATPKEYGYADAFDFSAPLDTANLYKNQGAANFGPYTNGGDVADKTLRAAIKEEIRLQLSEDTSPWHFLSEAMEMNKKPMKNVWETLSRLNTGSENK